MRANECSLDSRPSFIETRDHAAPEPSLALTKASSLACGRDGDSGLVLATQKLGSITRGALDVRPDADALARIQGERVDAGVELDQAVGGRLEAGGDRLERISRADAVEAPSRVCIGLTGRGRRFRPGRRRRRGR